MADRWSEYGGPAPKAGAGWSFEPLTPPSRLWGANGIVWGAGSQLMVTQVFGSQTTAIDVDTGEHRPFAPQGGGISMPDDGVFGADGSFYATEPMNNTVSVKNPDGSYRTLRDDLPGVNGITMDPARRRLFADEFRPGGRLLELDPSGEAAPRVLLDELNGPNALAVGPDGAIYFPQVIANEIWRYDLETGQSRLAFADLASPTAVKFDSQGRLLTSEARVGRLTRIDLATGVRETVAQVAPGIDNLAVGDGDRLFLSHFTDGQVAEVTGGRTRVLSEGGLCGPYGVAVRADGSFLVADGLSVAEIAPDGSVRRLLTLLADLPSMAIAVGELDGRVAVLVERGQLFLFGPDRERTSPVGRLRHPTSLAPGGDGVLLLVESGEGRVLRVDASGVIGEAATGLNRPHSAALGADGVLWVTEPDAVVGLRGGEVVSRVGGFDGLQGIAVGADGTVVVAEPAGRRLVAIDPASGAADTIVSDAPIGPPVTGARLPMSSVPVTASGRGFVVGANGEGSLRRLSRV
ncbi:MAG: SMP-30/gluconolactonase/LRE family protein [Acidimicrobiales bacterium]